jgi:hypothetical protein
LEAVAERVVMGASHREEKEKRMRRLKGGKEAYERRGSRRREIQ